MRQLLGLPGLIGVLVVLAVGKALTSGGVLVLGAMVLGLLVVYAIIGMAMSLGDGRPPRSHDERPKER